MPVRIFAISLLSADSVILSLEPASSAGAAFHIQLAATCINGPTAETAQHQLEFNTNLIRQELAREHQTSNPADLSGLLTSGTFQVAGSELIGRWTVRRELLAALR